MNIPFHKPNIPENLEKINTDSIKSGWLTTGSQVLKFEKKLSNYLRYKHVVALNSCTAGLHLALAAKEFSKGDKFFAPVLTFVSTIECGEYLGMSPVLVDCKKDGFLIDLNFIEDQIRRDTKIKAIIPMHYGGELNDMGNIISIAEKYGLFVLEDAAHAFERVKDGLTQRVLLTAGTGEPHIERLHDGRAHFARKSAVEPFVNAKGHPMVRHAREPAELAVLCEPGKRCDCAGGSHPAEFELRCPDHFARCGFVHLVLHHHHGEVGILQQVEAKRLVGVGEIGSVPRSHHHELGIEAFEAGHCSDRRAQRVVLLHRVTDVTIVAPSAAVERVLQPEHTHACRLVAFDFVEAHQSRRMVGSVPISRCA